MKVFITGSEGQLGNELKKILSLKNELFLGTKDVCNITDYKKVKSLLDKFKPEAVIHTAAYTDVDGAEFDKDLAFKVNSLGTRNMVLASEKIGAKFLYISTDFVFDGKKKEAYLEFDTPCPLSIYGQSKLAGEDYVKNLTNKYFILRTAWLYGGTGKNFVKTMLDLSKSQEELKVVNDQIGTPTYVVDLAKVIEKLIQTDLYGTYHVSNAGQCSWYDFAHEIFKLAGKKIKITPISSKELDRPAKRPAYSVLRNFCLEQQKIFMRDWQESLKEFINKIGK